MFIEPSPVHGGVLKYARSGLFEAYTISPSQPAPIYPSRQNPFQFPIYLLCFTFSFFILLLYYLFIYLFHCIMVTLPSLFHLSIYLLYIHRTTYLLLSVVTPYPTESEYYLYFLLYFLLTFILLVILFTTGLYRNTVVTPHPTEIILFTTPNDYT